MEYKSIMDNKSLSASIFFRLQMGNSESPHDIHPATLRPRNDDGSWRGVNADSRRVGT